MKKNVLTIGIIAFFVLNSVAFAVVGGMNFKDQYKFADWNRSAIDHLQQEGIVKGYGDGEFKPENNVTRAEMAVMMDRLYNNIIEQTGEVTMAYDDLKNVQFNLPDPQSSQSAPKVALAMAIAQLKENKDFNASLQSEYDFEKLTGKNIPQGYEVYQLTSLPTYQYYVHWLTDEVVPESGSSDKLHIDHWYGPFDPSVWYNNG